MPFFQKKPVVIEARQLTHDNVDQILAWINSNAEDRNCYRARSTSIQGLNLPGGRLLVIQTLEGDHQAAIGDWIIKGVKGEFYPCKPDIFESRYSPTGRMTYQAMIKNAS